MGPVLTLEYFIDEEVLDSGCQGGTVYCIQWFFKETVVKVYSIFKGDKIWENVTNHLSASGFLNER